MAWKQDELPKKLCADRMLEHIHVLVGTHPPSPSAPTLRQEIQEAVERLRGEDDYDPPRYALRCIRIFRAYRYAGTAVAAPDYNRNGPWDDCKQELGHAENGT